MEFTQSQFIEYVNSLPATLRRAYFDDAINEQVAAIGRRYSLHIPQAARLAYEVGRTIVGLTPTAQFVNVIQRTVGIDAPTALALTREIDEKIFEPIRDDLYRFANGRGVSAETPIETSGEQAHPAREDVLRGIETPESLPMKVREYPVSTLPARAVSAAPIPTETMVPERKVPIVARAAVLAMREQPPALPTHEHPNLPMVEEEHLPARANDVTPQRPPAIIDTPEGTPPATSTAAPEARPPSPNYHTTDPYREPVE